MGQASPQAGSLDISRTQGTNRSAHWCNGRCAWTHGGGAGRLAVAPGRGEVKAPVIPAGHQASCRGARSRSRSVRTGRHVTGSRRVRCLRAPATSHEVWEAPTSGAPPAAPDHHAEVPVVRLPLVGRPPGSRDRQDERDRTGRGRSDVEPHPRPSPASRHDEVLSPRHPDRDGRRLRRPHAADARSSVIRPRRGAARSRARGADQRQTPRRRPRATG